MIQNNIREENARMTKQKQLELRKTIAPYEKSNIKDSVWQIVNTIIPFFLLWYLAYESLSISYLLTLGLTVVAAGFLLEPLLFFMTVVTILFLKTRLQTKCLVRLQGF